MENSQQQQQQLRQQWRRIDQIKYCGYGVGGCCCWCGRVCVSIGTAGTISQSAAAGLVVVVVVIVISSTG